MFSVHGGGMMDGPGGQCVDVAGDDTGTDLTVVQLWGCQSDGTQLKIYTCNGTAAQQFALR